MKSRALLLAVALLAAGCGSLDLPSIHDSETAIAREGAAIRAADSLVAAQPLRLPTGNDIIVRLRKDMMNRIIQTLTYNRQDDVTITLYKTPSVVREEKTALFVSYTNYVDIDGGSIVMDLKSLRFDRFAGGRIDAMLELEGKGVLHVSGKYLGVPASLSPDIYFYLSEPVSFQLSADAQGNIVATPVARRLVLKTRASIRLLAWSVPWNQEIPLELTDLVKPVVFPSALVSEIPLPVPASKAGDAKYEFVPFELRCFNTSVTASDDVLELRTNAELGRK